MVAVEPTLNVPFGPPGRAHDRWAAVRPVQLAVGVPAHRAVRAYQGGSMVCAVQAPKVVVRLD